MNVESELKDIINRLYDIQDIANSPRLEEKIKGIISECQEAIRIRKDDIDMHREGYWKGAISQSRKPIKSSLEDRLIPYLEEFEEGYANALTSTDEMGNNARLDTFYEIFKNDYNLTDDDISKLEGAVQDIWHETEEEDVEHDMGEMYGAPHGATSEEALKHFE